MVAGQVKSHLMRRQDLWYRRCCDDPEAGRAEAEALRESARKVRVAVPAFTLLFVTYYKKETRLGKNWWGCQQR